MQKIIESHEGTVITVTLALTDGTQLTSTIRLAVQHLEESQTPSGYWAECFDTGVMPDAQTAIALRLLGVNDVTWTNQLIEKIKMEQRENGSWGVYPGDNGDLSTTVECYYALELYKGWGSNTLQKERAELFIRQQGGLRKCRNLTKIFLAIGREIPWSWLPAPRLYSWLFAKHTPVRIWDVVTFTRLHVAPMLILSSMRFRSSEISTRVLDPFLGKSGRKKLRRELRRSDWSSMSMQHPRLRRCLQFMWQEREQDGTAAGYHSSTFLILLAYQALAEPFDQSLQSAVRAIKGNLYVEEDFLHQQTCNGHVWNTALAVTALVQAGSSHHSPSIQKAVNYLLSKQHRAVGEWFVKSSVQPGGWGFSANNTSHPDTDDTVACLEAIYPFRNRVSQAWWKGVDWLLSMQNHDGGWSAFERNADKWWLESIPANDMKRAMSDPSTPDITGRVVEFLLRFRVLPRDSERIQKGIRWLLRHQQADGSWFGRWGTTYLYGTWCAVKALSQYECTSEDSAIRNAKAWILSIQLDDGSFGESCTSDLEGRYVPMLKGIPSQTSWGLDTLLHLLEMEESPSAQTELREAADKAVNWLIHQSSQGTWDETFPTGSAFPGALHIRYHIYPKVWPLMALSHYQSFKHGGGR